MDIKFGQMLQFSAESYSDYYVLSPVFAIKTFNLNEVVERVKKEFVPRYSNDDASPEDVINYLRNNNFIQDVNDCLQIHLGSYGKIHATIE